MNTVSSDRHELDLDSASVELDLQGVRPFPPIRASKIVVAKAERAFSDAHGQRLIHLSGCAGAVSETKEITTAVSYPESGDDATCTDSDVIEARGAATTVQGNMAGGAIHLDHVTR
jgi:hypothetical protein